jgi:hypothetical protein
MSFSNENVYEKECKGPLCAFWAGLHMKCSITVLAEKDTLTLKLENDNFNNFPVIKNLNKLLEEE